MDKKTNIDWGNWIITGIMLFVFWPVGLFLLFRQISTIGKPNPSVKRHPYDIKRDAEAAAQANSSSSKNSTRSNTSPSGKAHHAKSSTQKKHKKAKTAPIPGEISGKVFTIVGIFFSTAFGIALLGIFAEAIAYGFSHYFSDIFVLTGFLSVGLVFLAAGAKRRRQAKRFRTYLSYIGKNETVSIPALASAMGKRKKAVYRDLGDMLHLGVLPAGYIDMATERLILTDEGIPNPSPSQEPKPKTSMADENELLVEIRAVNDAIPDQTMSAKIDRIGEITAKILDYQRSHPEKSTQLRSFLNYYLPTTLKVLRAYAQLDAQGIEGENITAAKQRIENMMDQVVYGFEKQLDRLFQDDAMDITSDVSVLENMLLQDGLSGPAFSSYTPSANSSASPSSSHRDPPTSSEQSGGTATAF